MGVPRDRGTKKRRSLVRLNERSVKRLLRPGTPVRLRQKDPAWQEMATRGIHGALASVLNEAPFSTIGGVLTGNTPEKSFARFGWTGVQIDLVIREKPGFQPQATEGRTWAAALIESFLFERFGFVVAYCTHGQHYYASNDRRRKDCPDHERIGQMTRWRKLHLGWRTRALLRKPMLERELVRQVKRYDNQVRRGTLAQKERDRQVRRVKRTLARVNAGGLPTQAWLERHRHGRKRPNKSPERA